MGLIIVIYKVVWTNKNQRSTYMTISNNADRVPDKTILRDRNSRQTKSTKNV